MRLVLRANAIFGSGVRSGSGAQQPALPATGADAARRTALRETHTRRLSVALRRRTATPLVGKAIVVIGGAPSSCTSALAGKLAQTHDAD